MYAPLGADLGRYYDLFAICCALAGCLSTCKQDG